MSKGTMAKTKTEKGGKGSNVPTPAVAHEIVTGKFTDQDWCVFSRYTIHASVVCKQLFLGSHFLSHCI